MSIGAYSIAMNDACEPGATAFAAAARSVIPFTVSVYTAPNTNGEVVRIIVRVSSPNSAPTTVAPGSSL
jgi:hypothetical protein